MPLKETKLDLSLEKGSYNLYTFHFFLKTANFLDRPKFSTGLAGLSQ